MSYEVEYYELPDGSRPAEEFILAQDVKMQAKIFMALEFLEEKGPMLREPFSKPLGEGIFEVRAKQGTDISRVHPREKSKKPSGTGQIISRERRAEQWERISERH